MAAGLRVRLLISGRGQGVWFRDSTRQEAQKLGVTGWVRNLRDGRVELLAEGAEEKVRCLMNWCAHGPPMARVDQVESAFGKWTGEFDSFDIVFWK